MLTWFVAAVLLTQSPPKGAIAPLSLEGQKLPDFKTDRFDWKGDFLKTARATKETFAKGIEHFYVGVPGGFKQVVKDAVLTQKIRPTWALPAFTWTEEDLSTEFWVLWSPRPLFPGPFEMLEGYTMPKLNGIVIAGQPTPADKLYDPANHVVFFHEATHQCFQGMPYRRLYAKDPKAAEKLNSQTYTPLLSLGVRTTGYWPMFSQELEYTCKPCELDPRLAAIKRWYCLETKKPVRTMIEANRAWEWYKSHPSKRQTDIDPQLQKILEGISQPIDPKSPLQLRAMLHRMIELVKMGGGTSSRDRLA